VVRNQARHFPWEARNHEMRRAFHDRGCSAGPAPTQKGIAALRGWVAHPAPDNEGRDRNRRQ
jgi:hypothetical protein